MKILITVQTYYPKKDGVQMVTQYIAEGLNKIGHQVTIITSNFSNLPIEETHNNILIKRVKLNTKYGLYFGNKNEYINIVKKECKNNDVMINVCTQNAFTDILLKELKNISCKKILYMHGMYDFRWHKYNFSTFKNLINKIWKDIRWFFYYKNNAYNFKEYDKVIQLNKLCLGYEFFVKHYNIYPEIVENAADDRFFIKENKEIAEKNKRAICVSNYFSDKNQEFILKAFYKSNAKDIELVFIGSSETKYLNKLKIINDKLSKKYGARKVKFLVNVSRAETIDLIKKSYIYLFSSKHEVFPVSIIEAMSSGIPYISTDVGCLRALPGGYIIKNTEEMAYMIDLLFFDAKIKLEVLVENMLIII